MSGNSAFVMVTERGWRRGLGNLLRNEFAAWWKTRQWWIQCLIWGGVIGFMLGAMIFGSSGFRSPDEALFVYSIFAGMFPAVAVVIIMQDAIVGEKQQGTAAWVLSKPASRPAFILSKFAANSVGVLATMVVFPGVIAYAMLSYAAGAPLALTRFLPALGVIFLNHLFYLALTLMLGTLFRGRGPVIGLSLEFLFMQQYLVGMLPVLEVRSALDAGDPAQQPERCHRAGAADGSIALFADPDRCGRGRDRGVRVDRTHSVRA